MEYGHGEARAQRESARTRIVGGGQRHVRIGKLPRWRFAQRGRKAGDVVERRMFVLAGKSKVKASLRCAAIVAQTERRIV